MSEEGKNKEVAVKLILEILKKKIPDSEDYKNVRERLVLSEEAIFNRTYDSAKTMLMGAISFPHASDSEKSDNASIRNGRFPVTAELEKFSRRFNLERKGPLNRTCEVLIGENAMEMSKSGMSVEEVREKRERALRFLSERIALVMALGQYALIYPYASLFFDVGDNRGQGEYVNRCIKGLADVLKEMNIKTHLLKGRFVHYVAELQKNQKFELSNFHDHWTVGTERLYPNQVAFLEKLRDYF